MQLLVKVHYLGIDESNHGRSPEIFVAVYSNIPEDVIARNDLTKKRKNKKDFDEILGSRQFKHILIPKNYKEWFGETEIRIIAYYELIKNFEYLDKVIIDGEIRRNEFQELKKLLIRETLPLEIIAESRADITYNIVNIADQIANRLFQHYGRFKNLNRSTKFLPYLLTPKMEDHKLLLENLEYKGRTGKNPV